jgi:NAD(P)H-dependent FMN reductase
MFSIPVILGSTRRGRQSVKVARFLARKLAETGKVETEILDLAEYNFPIMEERLRFRDDPPPRLQEFAGKIVAADAIAIVTPEYNNGYPGVLKNALDYLLPEYKRKPFGIVTVSGGGFGGLHCLTQLRMVTLALGGFPLPVTMPVSLVKTSFDDSGVPKDPAYDQRADAFIGELLWLTEAIVDRKKKEQGGAA